MHCECATRFKHTAWTDVLHMLFAKVPWRILGSPALLLAHPAAVNCCCCVRQSQLMLLLGGTAVSDLYTAVQTAFHRPPANSAGTEGSAGVVTDWDAVKGDDRTLVYQVLTGPSSIMHLLSAKSMSGRLMVHLLLLLLFLCLL